MPNPEVRVVSPQDLRAMFNSGEYYRKAQAGELAVLPKRPDSHLEEERRGMPPCTLSQLLAYLDDRGTRVALVHQYRLADGRLGASGFPDPKELFHDGILYRSTVG